MALPVRPPVKPMLAILREETPRGEEWLYEPKWDGFRTIVFRDGDTLELKSRNDRPMNRYFPELVELLLARLPQRIVLDGEIVLPTDGGLQFDLLQMRLHPAASRAAKLAEETPVSFVAFDLLALGDRDLQELPLGERLELLDEALGAGPPEDPAAPACEAGPKLFVAPRTADADIAMRWFDDLEAVGFDGLICKRLDGPYVPGERVMVKIKHRRTADCVVGGYRIHKDGAIGSLLLGLYDEGILHYIGHTSSFKAAERRTLLEQLSPMRTERSFGGDEDWGPGGQSRWSQGKEQEWVAIEPSLVCEVSYDFVQSGHRFRHAARFLRWRDDKKPEECLFDQIR
jgi:ATP-dependent DNA ligase